MPIADALAAVAVLASPHALDNFRSHLDPEWIEQALRATGTSTIRKRRLPSEQVIWVVLCSAWRCSVTGPLPTSSPASI